jgi:hypothetical protein
LNRILSSTGEDDSASQRAIELAGDYLLAHQRPDGAWSWGGNARQVATFEGNAATIGLLQAYWATGRAQYADGARRWIEYLLAREAFRPIGDGVYAPYWSHRDIVVPNVSAEILWVLSEVNKVWPVAGVEDLAGALVRFLTNVQRSSGELPYRIANVSATERVHYLCYQYNAFEFLAIARFAENTGNLAALPLLHHLATFLLGGVGPNDSSRASCLFAYPELDYYSAALALALRRAEPFIGAEARAKANNLTNRLLSVQRADGSFSHSRRDYSLPFLSDRRSYPRTQAIVGYALAAIGGLGANRLALGQQLRDIAL